MRESVGTRFDPEFQVPVFETDADVVLRGGIPRAEVDIELAGDSASTALGSEPCGRNQTAGRFSRRLVMNSTVRARWSPSIGMTSFREKAWSDPVQGISQLWRWTTQ